MAPNSRITEGGWKYPKGFSYGCIKLTYRGRPYQLDGMREIHGTRFIPIDIKRHYETSYNQHIRNDTLKWRILYGAMTKGIGESVPLRPWEGARPPEGVRELPTGQLAFNLF